MIPDKLLYTRDHEWISVNGSEATVGITDFAQSQLGDITFVELPQNGRLLKAHEPAAFLESVKAANDVYSPVSGTVSATNTDLEGSPERVNKDPYNSGWIFKLSAINADETGSLMDAAAYRSYLQNGDN